MSDFWNSSIGEITGSENDAFAKSFTLIPDGTTALAKIKEFKEMDNKGFKYLQVDWLLMEGDFKGNIVQQKLKVFGGDQFDKDSEKTRHRALNMLKLLYQLFKIKLAHNGAPTHQDLVSFVGKIAGIHIRETAPNDKGRQYNWVSEVHASQGFKSETGVSVSITHTTKQQPMPIDKPDLSDDLPF